MKRALFGALSLALVATAGYLAMRDGGRGQIGPGKYRDGRGRVGREGPPTAAPLAPFVLTAYDYEWPYTGSRLPACTDDATCVAVCGIGIVTGSSSACECKGHDGLALGTITDPGGTNIDSFIPGVRAREVSFAVNDFCRVTSSTIDAVFPAGAGASTIITGVMQRANNQVDYLWERSGGTTGGNTARVDSGDWQWFGINTTGTHTAGQVRDSYLVYAITRSAASTPSYIQYSAAGTKTTAGGGAEPAVAGTGAWSFGNRPAANNGLNGPWIFTAFYSAAKTSAQLLTVREQLFGFYNSAGSMTGGGLPQATGLDNTATTGNVDILAPGGMLVSSAGLRSFKGFTNVWAADALAAATWVDVGTPAVTSNVTSGPFSTLKHGAECDLIVDDDVAAFEGKQSATAGTTAAYYNASCYLKAGTSGTTTTTARILFAAPSGTLSVASCDITGLTSTASRQQCETLVTGSPSSVKASILVGNALGETGSIQTCHCQLTKSLVMEPPTVDNTAHGDLYYSTTSAANWPDPVLGGKYELVHTALYDPSTTWFDANSAYYAFDVTSAADANHTVAIIFGYTLAGRMNAVIRGPGGEVGDLITDGVSLTVGQAYATSVEWRPTSGGHCKTYVRHDSCGATAPASCHASTIIASDVTGSAMCPGTPAKMTIGSRYDISIPASVLTNAVRVFSL